MHIHTTRSLVLALTLCTPLAGHAEVENYEIDLAHSFIQFRIKHLGYGWTFGRFNDFEGTFAYDKDDTARTDFSVEIVAKSVDSNNAERDKHLRDKDFLNVDKFPEARFETISYTAAGQDAARLTGNLSLHGVTNEVVIEVEETGAGPDPWGNYRRGFLGTTTIDLDEFGIDPERKLGPTPRSVELVLSVEGVRK